MELINLTYQADPAPRSQVRPGGSSMVRWIAVSMFLQPWIKLINVINPIMD